MEDVTLLCQTFLLSPSHITNAGSQQYRSLHHHGSDSVISSSTSANRTSSFQAVNQFLCSVEPTTTTSKCSVKCNIWYPIYTDVFLG